VFKSMGHRPVGLDGSKEFCKMAVKQSGCPTLNQQFLKLELEENRYDGIFANASLFTVPSQELPRVLKELHSALRKDGILFSSNPRGNAEGWQGQRYGHYMEFEASETFLQQSGFKIIKHFYRPEGMPREHQPWLAIVSQRQEQK
jgi:SAM-dependent methyltransferase